MLTGGESALIVAALQNYARFCGKEGARLAAVSPYLHEQIAAEHGAANRARALANRVLGDDRFWPEMGDEA